MSTTYAPLIPTPLPFPTLNSFVSAKNSFATETGWMIVIIVVHVIVFAVFIALLSVYMCCIKPEGKGIADDGVMDWDSSDESGNDDEDEDGEGRDAGRQQSTLSAGNKYARQDSFGISTPMKQEMHQQTAPVGVAARRNW